MDELKRLFSYFWRYRFLFAVALLCSVVVVEYTGWLESGKRFDSSLDRAEPLDLDLGQAMTGWAEGIGAMRPGERRMLRVPPALAYGERGRPPIIPGNATLLYEIELLEVR